MKIIKLFKEIITDKKLLLDLSGKDMQRRFSGTYFGVVWGIVQPLLTIMVYWAVFQFGFRSGDVGNVPFVLWFMAGIVSWLFISESFSNASNSFLEYNYLIQKVKFNVNILPLVKILSSFYIHLLFVVLVIIICCLFGYPPSFKLLQLFYYMFAEIVIVFSISLITSSIMVFFRDLNQIISVLLLMGMWGTPIAWSMSTFSERAQFILKFNPFYYIITGYRDSLLNGEWFWESPILTLYFWLVTFLFLFIGVNVYTRLKPHFADSI